MEKKESKYWKYRVVGDFNNDFEYVPAYYTGYI
jgi:hypothetical protein